jgi:hypothetical protein
MTVALRKPMSPEQFLAWEERQPLRYEFDGFQPVAMTGGTAAHSAILRNLIIALDTSRLCQPLRHRADRARCCSFGSVTPRAISASGGGARSAFPKIVLGGGLIAVECLSCGSAAVTERPDLAAQGYHRFRLPGLRQAVHERTDGVLNRASLPSDIIAIVVFCRLTLQADPAGPQRDHAVARFHCAALDL